MLKILTLNNCQTVRPSLLEQFLYKYREKVKNICIESNNAVFLTIRITKLIKSP